ncbi:hypothetical protein BsIDN1_19640 [Bacillus safensis]|uniref:Uncharacterized protein n=1 Tax=Bacillus safensis TaxID=561879 RepID=A0A5S9M9Y1_BACIA|nr:hypothetical protein BsIDN1_19640 [Bacillus safensis]
MEELKKRSSQTAAAFEKLKKNSKKDHHEKIDQSFQAIEQLYFYVCEFERAFTEWVKENKVRSSQN